MAITSIKLSDPIVTLVTKTNTISGHVGDVANLVTGDSNVVDALNTVRGLFQEFDDSAEIIQIARNAISVVDSGGDGELSYDAGTGTITYRGPNATEIRAHFSAGTGLTFNSGTYSINTGAITADLLVDSAITRNKFASLVTFTIADSSGSTLKSIYGPGI
jgi:hypothetical protein